MGVLVRPDPDSPTPSRYSGYLRRRAGRRGRTDLPPTTAERHERELFEDGDRVAEAGFDPGRFYRLLGYDLTEPPDEPSALRDAFVLSDDSYRRWSVEETAWMAEVCWQARQSSGLGRIAQVCYGAVLLDRTCAATRA